MPRLPIDYSKNINYKLCCLDQSITDIYIGQTTDFKNRKRQHKQANCNENNKDYNAYVYQFIREHGGWDNWQMIQIEEYPCNNSREAQARETYWMKEFKSTLNNNKSFRTEEERKEYVRQYNKTDKFKEYLKEYEKSDKRKEYYKSDKRKETHRKRWQRKALYLNELKCYNI